MGSRSSRLQTRPAPAHNMGRTANATLLCNNTPNQDSSPFGMRDETFKRIPTEMAWYEAVAPVPSPEEGALRLETRCLQLGAKPSWSTHTNAAIVLSGQDQSARTLSRLTEDNAADMVHDSSNDMGQIELPHDMLTLDIFAGEELPQKGYNSTSGHVAHHGYSEDIKGSFTCIVCVKPDYSDCRQRKVSMPILYCGTPPFGPNKKLWVNINEHTVYIDFGWNKLDIGQPLPEHKWSWLAFVFDCQRGKRVFVDGILVAEDTRCDPFCGQGPIHIGQGMFNVSTQTCGRYFIGSLAGLCLLKTALSNHDLRQVLRGLGLKLSRKDLAREAIRDIIQKLVSPIAKLSRRINELIGEVFKMRVSRLLDLISDVLVVIDNGTKWKFSVVFTQEYRPIFARVGLLLIVLPFFLEWLLLWNNGVLTLTKRGVKCPKVLYAIAGFPFLVALKVYALFASPFDRMGATQLSFLGAYEDLDLILEAAAEAPWQACLNLCVFWQEWQQKGKGRQIPYTQVAAFLSSLLMLREVYTKVRSRWVRESFYSQGISMFAVFRLMLQSGMGTMYSEMNKNLGSAVAVGEIVQALTPPSVLIDLKLMNCHISELSPISAALKINTTLRFLYLNANGIVDISTLAEALEENVALITLRLSSNAITDVSPFAATLQANSVLSELYLNNNPITMLGAVPLSLEANTTLTLLDMNDNKLTPEAKNELKAVQKDGLKINCD